MLINIQCVVYRSSAKAAPKTFFKVCLPGRVNNVSKPCHFDHFFIDKRIFESIMIFKYTFWQISNHQPVYITALISIKELWKLYSSTINLLTFNTFKRGGGFMDVTRRNFLKATGGSLLLSTLGINLQPARAYAQTLHLLQTGGSGRPRASRKNVQYQRFQ